MRQLLNDNRQVQRNLIKDIPRGEILFDLRRISAKMFFFSFKTKKN